MRRLGVYGLVAVVTAAGLATLAPSVAHAGSTAFSADAVFTVPEGVTSLNVTATGGGGGYGGLCNLTDPGAVGGKGALVTATIPVSSGSQLTIRVGGLGGTSTDLVGAPGGTNGGGAGGTGTCDRGLTPGAGGGGGGGYSGIFAGAVTQANALLIAGGGGGAVYESNGGDAGANANGDGNAGDGTASGNDGGGGGGGTTSAGGAGGAKAPNSGNAGSDGTAGTQLAGGVGGLTTDLTPTPTSDGGGGGGGGYFGGGGGGPDHDGQPGGGGAGSSYKPAGTGSIETASTVAAGSVSLSWTDPLAQTPVDSCVKSNGTPTSIPNRGTKTLMAPDCRTTAGQIVGVRVSARQRISSRGDLRYYSLYCKVGNKTTKTKATGHGDGSRYCTKGALKIRTYGTSLKLSIVWYAPSTDGFVSYKKTRSYRT